jgi:putative YphP/YqiW family bacilliredoxin
MYPPELVKPMREELTNIGFVELHSTEDVSNAL